ncbi:DUF1850 domain-containing protein [Manganibacter manganicus]|uniref:DUF1850 domain-containing protein n=1 Tax=Manganibacter manganicus TaxID=1873176 RepID=A0A1V8RPB0_9HYPH|nr:DUF1850 domain-containing protein [Pseudaminobacter manganicus]OQM74963.1 hypothetical protein BFN67_04315 [Pseudaminobacter manganicus]
MSICILAAGKVTVLAGTVFTLAWTHSVEKTRWEEHWQVTPAGLQVVEARIKGSGAGMDPPEGSVLKDGWWVYAPKVKPLDKLVLAASGATGEGWTLCTSDGCTVLGSRAQDPAVVTACDGRAQGKAH